MIFFAGSTARGDLTAATLPPTHTLTQMAKNLTLVVATPMRLGALPVVIINNCLGAERVKAQVTTINNNKNPSQKIKKVLFNRTNVNKV